jgi:hypothetical protein
MINASLRFLAVATSAMLGTALLAGPGCVITESDGEAGGGGATATTSGGGTTGEGGATGGGEVGGAGGAGGAGGQGGSSAAPFACGASECTVGNEQCCWDDNGAGTCVTDPMVCEWFLYECASPTHCGEGALCCVLPGLGAYCLPADAGDCGTSSTACDTVEDCPNLNGAPATGCGPSPDGGPAHNVCTW